MLIPYDRYPRFNSGRARGADCISPSASMLSAAFLMIFTSTLKQSGIQHHLSHFRYFHAGVRQSLHIRFHKPLAGVKTKSFRLTESVGSGISPSAKQVMKRLIEKQRSVHYASRRRCLHFASSLERRVLPYQCGSNAGSRVVSLLGNHTNPLSHMLSFSAFISLRR